METAPTLDSEKTGVCIGIYCVFKGCACRRGGDHIHRYTYKCTYIYIYIYMRTHTKKHSKFREPTLPVGAGHGGRHQGSDGGGEHRLDFAGTVRELGVLFSTYIYMGDAD